MLPDSMNVGVIAENIKKLETMVKEAGSELPTPEAGDVGKILKVGSDSYELATEYSYTPPAYSDTEEVNTGKKWIDGRDIYEKVFTGTFPVITASGRQDFGSIPAGCLPVGFVPICPDTSNTIHVNAFSLFLSVSGALSIGTVTTGYSECEYYVIVRYVKPSPTPEPTTSNKKTTKKGE